MSCKANRHQLNDGTNGFSLVTCTILSSFIALHASIVLLASANSFERLILVVFRSDTGWRSTKFQSGDHDFLAGYNQVKSLWQRDVCFHQVQYSKFKYSTARKCHQHEPLRRQANYPHTGRNTIDNYLKEP
jgi:hypothetical protein